MFDVYFLLLFAIQMKICTTTASLVGMHKFISLPKLISNDINHQNALHAMCSVIQLYMKTVASKVFLLNSIEQTQTKIQTKIRSQRLKVAID